MRRTIVLLLFGLCSMRSYCQSIATLAPSIPTSPQAESFRMHGEYNVNLSTGTPDITIPVYEIDHRGFKIPLSLKYVAQPIKPGYNYDVFGIGWSFSAGSSISRRIEYLPDEQKNFVLDVPSSAFFLSSCGGACISDYNYAPDKFNAILPDGSSFDFIMVNEGGHVLFKVSDGRQVKMTHSVSSGNIAWFTVTDENGIKYTFSGADLPFQSGNSIYQGAFVSWSLTRIDLPYTTDPILYEYDISMQSHVGVSCSEPSLKIGHFVTQGNPTNIYTASRSSSIQPYDYRMKLLTTISFGPNGGSKVHLDYKYPNNTSLNYIDKIRILEGSTMIKEVLFNTSSQGGQSPCFNFQTSRLDSLFFRGQSSSTYLEKYEFDYYTRANFSGTDHWGNLNTSGTDLPNFNIFTENDMVASFQTLYGDITPVTKLAGDVNPFYKYKISRQSTNNSDCRVPASPASHGVLRKIVYPTKGYTEFDYENHKFLTSTDNDGNYIYNAQDRVVKEATGFRIRTISSYSSVGVLSKRMNYRYGKTNRELYGNNYVYPNHHTGVGIAPADPNILTYMNMAAYPYYPYPIKNMILGLDENGQRVPFSNPFPTYYVNGMYEWQCNFSAANFRRVLGGRQPVLYSDVSVYEGALNEDANIFPKGKTVYKYDLDDPESGAEFFEPAKYYRYTLGYETKRFLYNKLVEQTTYKYEPTTNDFVPIVKELSSWHPSSIYYGEYIYDFPYPSNFQPATIPISILFEYKVNYLGYKNLVGKTKIEYNSVDNNITTYEAYTYNSRQQLISKLTGTSLGTEVLSTYKYPEVSGGSTPAVIQSMVAKNIISPVIESVVSKSPSNEKLSGKKVEYGMFGSPQIIMPAKVYDMVPGSANPDFTLEGEVVAYSPNGSPLEVVSKDNIKTSNIWGYDDRYMVAQVRNANNDDVAYSSFEDNSKGNWIFTGAIASASSGVFVPTGKRYYNLTGSTSITKSVTSGKAYVVSYWRNVTTNSPYTISGATGAAMKGRTVSGWTYFEHNITTSGTMLTVGGTGGIDELRLYPANSRMITFTYDPLIGITSQSDALGSIIYYEYDVSGRLKLVRDAYQNIQKRICYNYAGQPEPCKLYGNQPKSQTFTRNNCASGMVPGVYTYSVAANQFYAESQAAADALAQAQIDANGQNAANTNATCTYGNTVKSGTFIRNNCDLGETGSSVIYTVAANTYTSTVSQAAADALAQADVDANGQAYANANGTCTSASGCVPRFCRGEGQKCVNNNCETGVKVYTSGVQNPSTLMWTCTYHYEFSDGTWSVDYYEVSARQCYSPL